MCTGIRFTDSEGNLYFGRNLDWSSPFGETIVATQRGFVHDKLMDGKLTNKYAIIGTGIISEEFPLYFDAGNEKGLACAGLNFPGYAKYADAPIEGKENVPSYAFPLYLLAKYATVDEVEEALKDIAITAVPFSAQFQPSLLHWIVSDAKRCIVVEYTEDGMHVYDNDLFVLTNQPTFPYQHENVRSYISLTPEFPADVKWSDDTLSPYGSGSGMRGIPGDFYSPSRFIRAAYFNAHYPEQKGEDANVLRTFRTLQGAAMVLGGAKMGNGDFEYTTYTSCFSHNTMNYYYSSYEDPTIRKYEMSSVDSDGGKVVVVPETTVTK